jgi:hypothetical protein
MTPIESAALRSGLVTAAAYILFVFAGYALYPAADDEKLHAFTDPASLATLGVCWAGLFAFQNRTRKNPPPRTPAARIGWSVFTVLLISAAMVALYAGMTAAFFGGFWPPPILLQDQIRMFEAAIFAVAVTRIALPLFSRFDRMSPRNS